MYRVSISIRPATKTSNACATLRGRRASGGEVSAIAAAAGQFFGYYTSAQPCCGDTFSPYDLYIVVEEL
jgi:hypothetical protein